MGGSSSSTPEKPLPEPWRTIPWGENPTVLQKVKDYSPQREGQQLRILLHGPVGAGKSSFINSVQGVFSGRINVQALVDSTAGDSFTRKYTTHKVCREDRRSCYPFVFSDTMGLQAGRGVLVDDIKLVLRGHVKDGYRFNPSSKLSEDSPFYNNAPTSSDRVHVLVCVIPANTINTNQENEDMNRQYEPLVQKIRDIRMEASDLGIPQVAIVTKIDEVSPEIAKNVQNVYKNRSLRRKMDQLSKDVGIPMNCIFPVKNYHSEIYLDTSVDSLILSALTNIVNFGDDFLNFRKSSERLTQFPLTMLD